MNVPMPWKKKTATRKVAVATSERVLAGVGGEAKYRETGGAASVPTTIPTNSPARDNPTRLSPRRYPETAKPIASTTTMPSSRFTPGLSQPIDSTDRRVVGDCGEG